MNIRTARRLSALLLLCALTLSLCACSGDFDLKEFIKKYMTDEGLVSRDPGYIETLKNDEYTYEVYEDHILLTSYIGEATEVDVPAMIEGLPVTVIGSLCFYSGNDEVTSVTLPSTVTRLDDSAFYLCTVLTEVDLPDSIKSMGERCFGWCESLISVKLPSGLRQIPQYCFNYCTSLESIEMPVSCTRIGTRAFSYCRSLTDVALPSSVSELGSKAFSKCTALDYLHLPDSLTEIGDGIIDGSPECLVIASASSSAAMYCDANSIRFYTTFEAAAEAKGDVSDGQSEASAEE